MMSVNSDADQTVAATKDKKKAEMNLLIKTSLPPFADVVVLDP